MLSLVLYAAHVFLVLRPLFWEMPLSCPFRSCPVLSVLNENEKENEREKEKESAKEKENTIPGYGDQGNARAPNFPFPYFYRL